MRSYYVHHGADVDLDEEPTPILRHTLSKKRFAQCTRTSIKESILGKYFPYVNKEYKTKGDGNCCLQTLRVSIDYNEADWPCMGRKLLQELSSKYDHYETLIGKEFNEHYTCLRWRRIIRAALYYT